MKVAIGRGRVRRLVMPLACALAMLTCFLSEVQASEYVNISEWIVDIDEKLGDCTIQQTGRDPRALTILAQLTRLALEIYGPSRYYDRTRGVFIVEALDPDLKPLAYSIDQGPEMPLFNGLGFFRSYYPLRDDGIIDALEKGSQFTVLVRDKDGKRLPDAKFDLRGLSTALTYFQHPDCLKGKDPEFDFLGPAIARYRNWTIRKFWNSCYAELVSGKDLFNLSKLWGVLDARIQRQFHLAKVPDRGIFSVETSADWDSRFRIDEGPWFRLAMDYHFPLLSPIVGEHTVEVMKRGKVLHMRRPADEGEAGDYVDVDFELAGIRQALADLDKPACQ